MTTERAPVNLEALAQIIESERVELMQVHAMLRCLCDVLLYSDDDNASMHADVAKLTARLIDDCVGRLETTVARLKAEAGSTGGSEVSSIAP